MHTELPSEYLSVARRNFADLKKLGDGTLDQLTDAQILWQPNSEANSIAIIVQHLHGNMLSRWTDFFESDLEKPTRDRDSEFEARPVAKAGVLGLWETGWAAVLHVMNNIQEADLLKTVMIRGERMSALSAINRQISHYAYHIGQMVHIAKSQRGAEWQTLSIARGKSKEYKPEAR